MMQRLTENADTFPRAPLIEYVAPVEEISESERGPIDQNHPVQAEPSPDVRVIEPEIDPDPLRARALALGFTPLPRRACPVE
jgi:hypothetical protein